MEKEGFRICNNRGIHITFKNNVTVSIQFGVGNYCENRYKDYDTHYNKPMKSVDCELAIWDNNINEYEAQWITSRCPYVNTYGDMVVGYIVADKIPDILKWAKEYKED